MKFSLLRQTNVKTKLILVFLLCAVLPIVIIAFSATAVYSGSIQRQIDTLLDYSLTQGEQIVSEKLDSTQDLLVSLVTDTNIVNYGREIDRGDTGAGMYFMKEELTEGISKNPDVRVVVFISNNLDYCTYDKDNHIVSELTFYDQEERQRLYTACTGNSFVTLLPTEALVQTNGKSNYLFFIGIPVRDFIFQESYGVLLLGVRESSLAFLSSDREGQGNIDKLLSSKNIIVDAQNRIISHQDKSFIGRTLDEFIEEKISNAYILKEYPIQDSDWRLVDIVDRDGMLQGVRGYSAIVLAFSLLTAGIFAVVTFTITTRYSRSIRNILEGIQSFGSGDRNARIEVEEKDELLSIARQFNHMAARINSLITNLQEEKRNTEIAVNQKRKSELKALESQINPHFLYNTLDTINWMAIDNGQEEISEMLSDLGSLLRYSISNIDVIVFLAAEIEWNKKYLYLQQARFNHSFACEYHIEEAALQFPIYKLVLQPIIENAVVHGFDGVKTGGVLSISAKVRKNALLLEIQDNGVGMEREVLEDLTAYINNDELFDGNSIGLKNTVNRLRLYYSGKAKIKIESEPGKGTKVFLKIPYKEKF